MKNLDLHAQSEGARGIINPQHQKLIKILGVVLGLATLALVSGYGDTLLPIIFMPTLFWFMLNGLYPFKKLGIVSRKIAAVSAVFILMAMITFMSWNAQITESKKQRAEENERSDFQNRLARNDPKAVLAEAEKEARTDNWVAAVNRLRILETMPDAPADLKDRISKYQHDGERYYKKELEKTPIEDTEIISAYKNLVQLVPENKRYKSVLDENIRQKDKALKEAEIEAEQKRLKEEKLIAQFGPMPVRSNWDGSYPEVKRHLENSMHDPDSLKMEECTWVRNHKSGWLVGCQYRGKNAFGATILTGNWFLIRQNQVVRQEPWNAYKL